ncbi:MAG: hypothetical protein KQH63_18950 [Desulfobulbaceae bacterium]|nr:hypothetical protein [Desulfobulbaceae bacterium]
MKNITAKVIIMFAAAMLMLGGCSASDMNGGMDNGMDSSMKSMENTQMEEPMMEDSMMEKGMSDSMDTMDTMETMEKPMMDPSSSMK